jgi:hypothetical protein
MFNLGVAIVFAVLAAVITVTTVYCVETNPIREVEHRVKKLTRAAWEIRNNRFRVYTRRDIRLDVREPAAKGASSILAILDKLNRWS